MFRTKLPLLLLGFIVLGTALTYVQARAIDEYDEMNEIDSDYFENKKYPLKTDVLDDEEVEEGDAEERNVLNELDLEDEEAVPDEAEEEENEEDEEEFEEEITADAEEEEAAEEEEKAIADEEEAIAEEEEAIADEEEAIADEEEEIAEAEEKAAEEDNEIVDDNGDAVKKPFPYNWYDKVKKFFKGRK